MTWFKVDDQFYLHPKVVGLDMAARGLWVSAGSYCAAHLTDGVLTGAQLKAIGGTHRQAAALVAADLWTADDAPPSARRYEFKNWAEFQPLSGDVEARREEWRKRKRNARREKGSEQGRSENVPAGLPQDVHPHVQQMSGTGTPQDVQRMSGSFPVPSRPDPIEGEVVGEVQVRAREEFPSLDDLVAQHAASGAAADAPGGAHGTPDDPRCAEHAHLDRADVPPCRACAAAREHYEAQAAEDHRQRRTLIDACDMCDDRGLVDTTDSAGRPVAVKCNHTTPPARPTATHTAFQPTSDPNTRKALFNALNERTVPQPPF